MLTKNPEGFEGSIKSPEPTAVGAVSSAVAVQSRSAVAQLFSPLMTVPRWIFFYDAWFRLSRRNIISSLSEAGLFALCARRSTGLSQHYSQQTQNEIQTAVDQVSYCREGFSSSTCHSEYLLSFRIDFISRWFVACG
jgi:hypothetical protein